MKAMRETSNASESKFSEEAFNLGALVARRRKEATELWAKTINPQFARVLRTIGFDREWARTEGAYLWDADGNRYLDMLGGFGMFNVGRNNPRIRAALIEALELDLPGSVQMGTTVLPPLLAEALLARTPARPSLIAASIASVPLLVKRTRSSRAAT